MHMTTARRRETARLQKEEKAHEVWRLGCKMYGAVSIQLGAQKRSNGGRTVSLDCMHAAILNTARSSRLAERA